MAAFAAVLIACCAAGASAGKLAGTQRPLEKQRRTPPGLWGGSDDPAAVTKSSQDLLRRRQPAERLNVQILALQNSGADLVTALMKLNFGAMINYYNEEVDGRRKGLWLHSNIKEKFRLEPDAVQSLRDANVKAIIMIRNPMSWLQSLRDSPKELESCVVGDDWLVRACKHTAPCGPDSRVPAEEFPNLPAIWNQWNDGFDNADQFGFTKHLVLQYENLVRNPEGSLARIANFLEIKEPVDGFKVPPDSTRDAALDYIQIKRYMEQFSEEEMNKVCTLLDNGLESEYDYDDCAWRKGRNDLRYMR